MDWLESFIFRSAVIANCRAQLAEGSTASVGRSPSGPSVVNGRGPIAAALCSEALPHC
jgi:hypothetical protein